MTQLGTQPVEPPATRSGESPPDEIAALCARLRRVTEYDASAEEVRPQPNPERDRLLGEYRRIVSRRIHADARVNLDELQTLTAEASDRGGIDLVRTPVGVDAFGRLRGSLARITETDPYADWDSERRWYVALHQFYLDGLALADRLLAVKQPESPRRWRRRPRQVNVLGLSCPGRMQAGVTALETAVPDLFRVNPFATYVPTMMHLLGHYVFARKRFRFPEVAASTQGWIRRNGFNRLGGVTGPTVCCAGLEHLRNEHLFDTRSWRTRHNLIIACVHRLGHLDTPLIYVPMRGIRAGLWADSHPYGPGMDRKMNDDRYTVTIGGDHDTAFKQRMLETADLLVHARVPVLIMVDGSQPPLFYGQQMRIKPGMRLAIKAALRASAGTGRRTYVLPLALNDPVGFLQGRQQTMRVTFHPPVQIDSIRDIRRRDPNQANTTVNEGDPLINHLEALFLLETSHAVHGLPRPRIVAASRRRRRNRHREPLVKRWFQTSIADLAKQAGATRINGGPAENHHGPRASISAARR